MRQYEDLLIDALLDHGFTVEEAERLVALQARVERERTESALRRWLGAGQAEQGSCRRDVLN
jgi:hypothetical protein